MIKINRLIVDKNWGHALTPLFESVPDSFGSEENYHKQAKLIRDGLIIEELDLREPLPDGASHGDPMIDPFEGE